MNSSLKSKARILGRFVLYVRGRCGNAGLLLGDLLIPEKFHIVVECAKLMGDEYEKTFKKIWQAIQKAAVILKGLAIGRGDNDLLQKCQEFCLLMECAKYFE